MAAIVSTAKQLGKALDGKEERIALENGVQDFVVKIQKVSNVAWFIAIGSIGIAVGNVLTTVGSAGVTSFVTVPTATVSLAPVLQILGIPTTIAVLSIVMATKGTSALKALRQEYEIIEKGQKVFLVRGEKSSRVPPKKESIKEAS